MKKWTDAHGTVHVDFSDMTMEDAIKATADVAPLVFLAPERLTPLPRRDDLPVDDDLQADADGDWTPPDAA